MSDYHEPSSELSADDRDLHRALTSLKEEIEAVDWYHQRVGLTKDDALRGVLAHNRDEEIEHACMTLEWLRRRVPAWQRHLATYLFSRDDILEIEAGGGSNAPRNDGQGLGIGALSASASEAGARIRGMAMAETSVAAQAAQAAQDEAGDANATVKVPNRNGSDGSGSGNAGEKVEP